MDLEAENEVDASIHSQGTSPQPKDEETQATVQLVFSQLVHNANHLFSDISEFLKSNCEQRTVVIVTSNNVDSLCAAYILQTFLVSFLGVFVRFVVINNFLSLRLVSDKLSSECNIWVFVNCCARQNVVDLMGVSEMDGDILFCLIDYLRPFDPSYVASQVEHYESPSNVTVHIYLSNDCYQSTKEAVFDSQAARLFSTEANVPSLSRLTQSLTLTISGEYSADPASLICLEAVMEHGQDSAKCLLACSIGCAYYLCCGELTYERYGEIIEELHRRLRRKRDMTWLRYSPAEINIPLLRLQPLNETIASAIMSVGHRLTNSATDLSGIRTEMELTTHQWEETPTSQLLEEYNAKIRSVLQKHICGPFSKSEMPMLLVRGYSTLGGASCEELSNVDLALIFGYNLKDASCGQVSISAPDSGQRLLESVEGMIDMGFQFVKIMEVLGFRGSSSFNEMVEVTLHAQKACLKILSTLYSYRRVGVFGIPGVFEGFFYDQHQATPVTNTFVLKRISYALSRLITNPKQQQESLSHVVLLMPSSEGKQTFIYGFLPYQDSTRTNRIGAGLTQILSQKLGLANFCQSFLESSLVVINSEIAKTTYHALFPRKRVRKAGERDEKRSRREERGQC